MVKIIPLAVLLQYWKVYVAVSALLFPAGIVTAYSFLLEQLRNMWVSTSSMGFAY